MKKIRLFIYYSFVSNLPSSWWPGGNFFNYIRTNLVKTIFPLGQNVKIQKGVYFGKGNNVSIGSNCQINENVRLDNVSIQDNVMVARNVVFLGKMHIFDEVNIPMNQQGKKKDYKKSIVESDVWIGINSVILPGIKIGKGCIIGAGAVVTKDTEPYGVYVGVPAKKIKSRI